MSSAVRHRLINFLQSLGLLAAMGGMAWIIVATIAGPEVTAAIIIGSVIGMMLLPSLPKDALLMAHRAKRITGEQFPEGVGTLAELSRRAALPRVPSLYYIPSKLPNAFAVGSPEDSAICVSDGLLRLLDLRELSGVLAHEISHIAHNDLWIMGLADVMSRAVSIASWIGQFLLILNLPLVVSGQAYIPWHIPLLLVFSPTIMALMQLALSRTREYDADHGAASLTGDPDGLASALSKLERKTGRFWEDIVLPGRRIPQPSLLRTHPPTEERIRRLREIRNLAPRPRMPGALIEYPVRDDLAPPRFGKFGFFQ